jgi:hypothetical protein
LSEKRKANSEKQLHHWIFNCFQLFVAYKFGGVAMPL